MPQFIPGLELNRRFYLEVIYPILSREFTHLHYSAARLGTGSEVLGYDTPMSADHDWGLRLQLFFSQEDFDKYGAEVTEKLRHELPYNFLGYSTHFGEPDDEGTRLLAQTDGPRNHRVEVWTVRGFFEEYMACDPYQEPTIYDWLTWPQQHLLGVTAGQVYADDLGDLAMIRHKLLYYPHDVWLYLLAAQWSRIGQEEAFVGRTGDIGDELGSRILAARLVHDLMQLCFLIEKTYAPYPKWFGVAFSRLTCASTLMPTLSQILDAQDWRAREDHLCQAYETVAKLHNGLQITEPLATDVRYFHGRLFRVIGADRFVSALRKALTDETVREIRTNIGSIDQFSHSTDLRSYSELHKKLQLLYK